MRWVQTCGGMPTVEEVTAELGRLGKPATVAIYRSHGVTQPCVGLGYADLGKLARRLGQDHELGVALWGAGVHDARILGARLVDPARMKLTQLTAWLRDVDNHVLCGALAGLAARSPAGPACAERWSRRRAEWPSATGWNVYAELAGRGELAEPLARSLLSRIEADLRGAPNRTRHAMNSTLISIGGYLPALRQEALRVADAVGPVVVDHGKTGCRTPEARGYILKMAARAGAARRGAPVGGKRRPAGASPSRTARARSEARSRSRAS